MEAEDGREGGGGEGVQMSNGEGNWSKYGGQEKSSSSADDIDRTIQEGDPGSSPASCLVTRDTPPTSAIILEGTIGISRILI